MVETPEITYIMTYRCPRCHAALEARTSESHTWVRCPRCGRANLPPEHTYRPPREPSPLGDDVLVIGPSPDFPGPSHAVASHPDPHSGSARRITLAVGILVSLTLLAMAFIDKNMINVVIFGFSTIVLFLVLGYTVRPS
jgi:hypothetical protein